jgi:hypothetical protein
VQRSRRERESAHPYEILYFSGSVYHCVQFLLYRSRIIERTISLRFLGIILRVLRLLSQFCPRIRPQATFLASTIKILKPLFIEAFGLIYGIGSLPPPGSSLPIWLTGAHKYAASSLTQPSIENTRHIPGAHLLSHSSFFE